MANDFTQDRLTFLRGRQQARQKEQGPSFGGKGPFGAPRSGFLGERSYLDAANEDGELANLEAMASTGQPAGLRVSAAAPGLRATRPGVGGLSLYGEGGDYDPQGDAQARSSAIMRQSDADAGQAFNLSRARIGAERQDIAYNQGEVQRTANALDTPAFEMGSGRTGKFAQISGDIERDQAVQDARTKAGAYFDPLITRQREAEQADKERELEIRYNRQDETNAKILAAQIAADSRLGVAQTNANGGLVREGVRGMVRSNETSQFTRPDPNKQSTVDQMLLHYAQGGTPEGPPPPGGYSDTEIDAMMEAAKNGDQSSVTTLQEVWSQLAPEQQQAALARSQQRHRTGR